MIAHDKTDLGGGLYCYQPFDGPRFSLDALALAHLAPKAKKVLELGTASGVVSFIYHRLHPQSQVVGIDLFLELIVLANKAKSEQNLEGIAFQQGDVRHFSKELRGFDLVLVNPPYFRKGEGKPAKNERLSCARSEERANLADFLKAGAKALCDLGYLLVILPPFRLSDAIFEGRLCGLHAERLMPIASYHNEEAVLFLLTFQKSGKHPLVIDAPLVFYDAPGQYSPQVASWYEGDAHA